MLFFLLPDTIKKCYLVNKNKIRGNNFMDYFKLRIAFVDIDVKDRFYRVLLIKDDIDLFKLGVIIALSFNASFSHSFYIEDENDISYKKISSIEEKNDKEKCLLSYYYHDLSDSFKFFYCSGEGYAFNCTKEGIIDYPSDKEFILIEGKGQGIWEDDISALHALFDGKIKPRDKEKKKSPYKLPWNFDNKYFGDFDMPLDISNINNTLNEEFDISYIELYLEEREYCKNNNISLKEVENEDIPSSDIVMEEIDRQLYFNDYVKHAYECLKEKIGEHLAKERLASIYIKHRYGPNKFNQEEYIEDISRYITKYIVS